MLSTRCTRSLPLRPTLSASSSTSSSSSRPPFILSTLFASRSLSSTPTTSAESDPYLSPLQKRIVKKIRNAGDPDTGRQPTPERSRRAPTMSLTQDVWPPPASYKKKSYVGLPSKKDQTSFGFQTRPGEASAAAGSSSSAQLSRLSKKDKDGWTFAAAPGSEPWNPADDGFKPVKFYKGGVSGGVPRWIQRKKDAEDDSKFNPSRARDGDTAEEEDKQKKPRMAGGRHDFRSRTSTTGEHYESGRTLSVHLLDGFRAGHLTLEDCHSRVLKAPGMVGEDAGVWNTLMTIALKHKKWTKAVGFYNEMKRRNIKPSTRTFSILLSNLPSTIPATQQSLTVAAALYTSVTSLSASDPTEYPPSSYPINAYLSFLARVNRFDIMERVWEDLPSRGVGSPDTLAWTAMFHGLVKREDAPEAIEDGKKLWKGLVDSVMGRTGLKIDTRLLAMVMRLFLRGEQREEKELALKIATSYFVLPESVSSSLLKWLDTESSSSSSAKIPVPKVAEDQKFPPEEHSLETFFNLILALDRPHEAIKLYQHYTDIKQPLETRSMVTTAHLNRALAACVAAPDSNKAWDFLRQKSAPNAFPNLGSYHIAMEACAAGVDWEKAVELFKFTTGVKESSTTLGRPSKVVPDVNFAAQGEKKIAGLLTSPADVDDTPSDSPSLSSSSLTIDAITTTSPTSLSTTDNSSKPTLPVSSFAHKTISISPRSQRFPPDARLLSAFYLTALSSSPKTPCVREALRLSTAFHALTSFALLDPHPADYRTTPLLNLKRLPDPNTTTPESHPPLKPRLEEGKRVVTKETANRQFYQRKLVQTFGRCLDIGMRADTWGQSESRDWAYLKEELRKKVEGSHLEVLGGAQPGGGGFEAARREVEKGRMKEGDMLGAKGRLVGAPVEVMQPGEWAKRTMRKGEGGLLWRE